MALTDFGAMVAPDNGKGQQRLLMAPGHLEMSDDDGFETSFGVKKDLVPVQTVPSSPNRPSQNLTDHSSGIAKVLENSEILARSYSGEEISKFAALLSE